MLNMKRSLLFSIIFLIVGSLFLGGTTFASTKRVTNISYGSQTGTATAGTGTSVTYTITVTEGSTFGFGTSSDDILLTWAGGTPTGVTWLFSSSQTMGGGVTTTTPTFTPSGSNTTITFTVTTSNSTPAGTYPFTLKFTDNNGGGGPWTSSGLDLTVDGGVPTISYTGSPFSYYAGQAISSLTPTVTNSPTSYSISPALPAGLSFSTSTGVISGTPTASSSATTYTVTATNASGSSNTTINITVLSPTISYTGSPYTYLTGTTISSLTPTVTGSPSSYSIGTALPAGLSFNTSTGVISGTPTTTSASTVYTVTANYAAGVTATTTINITVNLGPPNISYTPATKSYPSGTAISTWSPVNTGGAAVSWSVSPGLPAGLSLNTGTGDITGTPTTVSSATTYTVTATNVAGSSSTSITITILPVPPVISYTPSSNTYTVGTAISSWTPVNTGGAATSWSASPSLPTGLSFNTSTGAISGTPTVTDTATFTITATNAGGSGTATINITVLPKAPVISYSPSTVTYTVGTSISPLSPTNTGGPADTYSIGPSLPAGLSFNTTTGVISGTPTTTSPATTYVISADNDKGTSTTSVTITCNNPSVPNISYSPSTKTAVVGTAITAWTPTNSGGTATSWSINTPLPAGLSFNTSTGAITGTPTATSSATTYTVTATNAAGSASTTITLTVNPQAPVISYTPSTNTYSVGATISSLTPANTGGAATSWAITAGGALPSGLSFNTSTGVISGTPTATKASTTYTITATNATGSGNTTVTISVNNNAPNISYSPGTVTYSVGTTITPASPTNSGGAASTWAITAGGSLPSGLSLNTSTGVISGTPTAVFPTTTFTIKATNSSGNSSTNLIITVSPHAPVISYTPSTNVYRLNATIPNLDPTNTGGAVTGYSYSPSGTSLTGASLSGPSLMTIDASGNIYVANYYNKTISKYNSSNVYVGTYTSGKTFTNPEGIVFDSAGNCYVEDTGAGAIYKFNSSGVYQSTIISGLNHPLGISIDPSDNLYIATYVYTSPYTSSVTKYNTSGTLLMTLNNSQMDQADGVAVDGSGNIYVLNRAQDQAGTNKGYVTKYNSSGTYLGVFSSGYEDPLAISCDPSGNVFVADSHNNQVKIYSSNGVLLNTISGFNDVEGFVADGNGNLYVSDFTNNTVKEFAANGGYRISSPLPSGLSFDTTTGEISGTPAVTFGPTTYTITAYNITGSGSTTVTLSCVQSNDWIGVTSTDWNTASNWRSGVVPNSAQSALIGVNESFNYFPNVLTASGTVNVGSIQFGNVGSQWPGVNVNSGATLNVVGAITYQSDASSGLGYNATLTGSGTITANSISVISNTTLGSSYTSTMASSVTNLNIATNIALTSTASGATTFNSTFNLTGGTTVLTGTVQTTNASGTTSTFALVPTTATTLKLASSTALSGLSATGTNVVTFNATNGTVEYSGAAQTVYTATGITGLSSGVSYQNIAFSGTGIKTASGNLNIAGNFTNTLANDASNYVNFTGATVTFNGTTQTLSAGSGNGTTFTNVNFSGAGTKTMSSGMFYISKSGVLTMQGSSSSTILAANGNLTLLSVSSGSASIAAIPTGPSITGTVNVQRYITGGSGYRSYRLTSSPVYAGTVSSNNVYSINYLQNSIYLTGDAGGGFDKTGNPTLYLYREDITPSNATYISGNWWGISKINNSPSYTYYLNSGSTGYNIPVGNGYLFFYRGNRAATTVANETVTTYTPGSVALTASGTLNQGQVIVHPWNNAASATLNYTGSGAGTNALVRGFNLVGNPYASTIDWESFNTTTTTSGIYGSNVGTTVYELNPLTSNFDTYQKGGVYTNHGRRYIVSGEGFFVVASNSSAQLIFNETSKSTAQNTGLNLFMSSKDNLAALSNNMIDQHLRLQMAMDTINTDDIYIGFNSAATEKFISNEDAPYRQGSGKVSLSSISSDGVNLAINRLPLPAAAKQTEIPLNVTARTPGVYSLNMTELEAIPQVYQVWLMDSYKKDSLDMRHNQTYAFNITSDTTTFGKSRFKLVLREDPALMVHLLNFTAVKVTQGSKVSWTTENEQNYTRFTVERSTDGGATFNVLGGTPSNATGVYNLWDTSPASKDMYRLKIEDLNGNITYSNVVTLMYTENVNGIAKSNISLYPNPAKSTINLTINAAFGSSQKISQSGIGMTNLAATPVTSVYNIRIVSSTGGLMKTATTTQTNWQNDVSRLLPGTYILQVVDNNNNLVGETTFVKL
ncbi:hypothetical protein FRZ54_12265 [Mucilaginibacter ginsenosidivorans]|uniref:Secretion system C-terminal sorting domain-containing protein n=2 Tax=Mucilaginibacter ginsenosidivorans TaxID=398053 RepID=A0A5B8UW09_9SPHI|nr:hypothetical protein FRZ54_12265 [Mucilaginibacter ginsenosidivorans]